jgi:WD40 repeat protein
MDFSPDGSLLATANDNRVSLFEREHKWLIREFRGHTARIEAVAFSATERTLASGSASGEVATWDVDTGVLLKLRQANTSQIAGMKYTSGGQILTAGWDPSPTVPITRAKAHASHLIGLVSTLEAVVPEILFRIHSGFTSQGCWLAVNQPPRKPLLATGIYTHNCRASSVDSFRPRGWRSQKANRCAGVMLQCHSFN